MSGAPLLVVAAPNAFKECLDAREVGAAMQAGVGDALPGAEVAVVPLADGGDGTMDLLVSHLGGRRVAVDGVADPLGRPVRAEYGLVDGGRTAVVEMASASGLALLREAEKDALATTSYGFGQLVAHALAEGATKLLLCIGGSATNDGGAGMAAALGYRLLDEAGQAVAVPRGGDLARIARIDSSGADPRLAAAEVVVACDVDNPLLGPDGATERYGPQKGATTAEQRRELERGLERLAALWARDLPAAAAAAAPGFPQFPGAGAAGGLGAGLAAFCGARLEPGFALVAAEVGLAGELARGPALVLTGEGRLDATTAAGKVPAGVSRAAAASGCGAPVFAFGGSVDLADPRAAGFDAAFSVCAGPVSLADAMVPDTARGLIRAATANAVSAWAAGRRGRQ